MATFTFNTPYKPGTPVSLTLTIVTPPPTPTTIPITLVVYPYTITDALASFIASHFTLVDFGLNATVGWEKIKTDNPNIIMIAYYDFSTVSSTQDDYSTINAHEDWFLHSGGTTSAYRVVDETYGEFFMDISNPGWQNYVASWCANALSANPLIDGIFADNVQEAIFLGWNPFYQNGVNIANSSIIPQAVITNWDTYMIQLIQAVKSAMGNKLLVINTPDPNGLLVQYCDGQMIEGFMHAAWKAVTDYSQDPLSGIYSMPLLSTLSATGKIIIAFSGTVEPASPTAADIAAIHQCMLYCYAGFLLAYGGKATFGFQMLHYDTTGQDSYWPEFGIAIGTPLGASYLVSGSLYARDFSAARVYLNISDTVSYNVTYNGTNHTIGPRSGLIAT